MKKYFMFVSLVVFLTSCAALKPAKRGCPMVASAGAQEQLDAKLDSYTDATHCINSTK